RGARLVPRAGSLARRPSRSAIDRNPFGMRIHVEALVAEERNERWTNPFRGLHGQVRGRRHGTQDRDARNRGLLDELEAQAARDQQDQLRERETVAERSLTD